MADIDWEYELSPSKWCRDQKTEEAVNNYIKNFDNFGKIVKSSLKKEFAYGKLPEQKILIFQGENCPEEAPLFCFIHGGYWQALDVQSSIGAALIVDGLPIKVAIIGYEIAPKSNMSQIINDIKQATELLLNVSDENKFKGIYLCGHSAGGHLAALMMSAEFGSKLSGFILLSGIFELKNIIKTSINAPLNMSEKDAEEFSPINKVDEIKVNLSVPVYILVGEYDPRELIRQSKEYGEKLINYGMKTVINHIIPGKDHFNYFYDIHQPELCSIRSFVKKCILG
ncbi:DgyrCDS10572 [Dimorphilus gyrociliatus]|uniref:DgyrCDS10572 n=1 Tax=Dimorphilus gyrociliatus TaxID=2664684 RepID=A0A7I8W362_9ANNE|nr:DgyrCDS10572 [Dimorphilus gyrociliatus]